MVDHKNVVTRYLRFLMKKVMIKKTVSIIISQSCNTQGQAETCGWFYMKLSHQHMLIDYVPLHSSGCKHL